MIATKKMIVNESKSGDSLTFVSVESHPNTGKKYNKGGYKKKITKYFRMSPNVADILQKYCDDNNESQSKVIEKSVKEFLDIK